MNIIALRGKADTGKSTSLKMLISMLDENKYRCEGCAALHPYAKSDSKEEIAEARNCIGKSLLLSSDIYAVFRINNKYIGITTQGDSDEYLKNSLSNINKVITNNGRQNGKCDVFVCSVRTYGNTCNLVSNNIKNEGLYFFDKSALFVDRTHCNKISELSCLEDAQNNLNELQAKGIMDFCIKLLKLK